MIIRPIWELFICEDLHTVVAKNNLKKDWIFGAKIWDEKVECWEIILRKKHEIVQNSKKRNIVVECILTMSKVSHPQCD